MDFWVTGGAGFIGSALAKELNNNSIYDILIVDDLSNGEKFSNLKKLTFSEGMSICHNQIINLHLVLLKVFFYLYVIKVT